MSPIDRAIPASSCRYLFLIANPRMTATPALMNPPVKPSSQLALSLMNGKPNNVTETNALARRASTAM